MAFQKLALIASFLAITLFISKGNAVNNQTCGQCLYDLCGYPCMKSSVSACENCMNIDIPVQCNVCIPGTCTTRNVEDNKTCANCMRKICGPPCEHSDSACKNCLDKDIPNLCGCCNNKH